MEFDEEIRGATPSWIVSVLKVGADDASSGNSEKLISPRMLMNASEDVERECLPATLR